MSPAADIDPSTGDRILREARTSWWVLWPRVVLAVVGAGMAAAGAFMQDAPGYGLAIAGVVACLWAGVGALVRRRGTAIRLTDRCIVVLSGLASRHTSTMMLERIEAIDIDQSFLQRMVGIGTLTIRGTGSEDLRFAGMQDPMGFQAEARRAIDELGGSRPARRDERAA